MKKQYSKNKSNSAMNCAKNISSTSYTNHIIANGHNGSKTNTNKNEKKKKSKDTNNIHHKKIYYNRSEYNKKNANIVQNLLESSMSISPQRNCCNSHDQFSSSKCYIADKFNRYESEKHHKKPKRVNNLVGGSKSPQPSEGVPTNNTSSTNDRKILGYTSLIGHNNTTQDSPSNTKDHIKIEKEFYEMGSGGGATNNNSNNNQNSNGDPFDYIIQKMNKMKSSVLKRNNVDELFSNIIDLKAIKQNAFTDNSD